MSSSDAGSRRVPLVLTVVGALLVLLWAGSMWLDWPPIGQAPAPSPTPSSDQVSPVSPTVLPPALTVMPTTTAISTPILTPVEAAASISVTSPTQPAEPAPTVTPSITPLVPSGPTPSPSATWPPQPTYTPPPNDASLAAQWDHYWLARPIPYGFTDWTDRIYPYGATRGGMFPTHHGVEFYNPVGVPVVAAANGMVVAAGTDSGTVYGPQTDFYGNLVIIRHDQFAGLTLYTVYGHLSEVLVAEGQMVAAREEIGLVGGTGAAAGGAHLHFEVRFGENSYATTRNPVLWLQPYPGWGTIAGQVLWPDGSYAYEAPLIVRRADEPGLFVDRTVYTYADDEVNSDDNWRENFTTPDLEPGPYEVILRADGMVLRELVWVYPGQTSFVVMELDGS